MNIIIKSENKGDVIDNHIFYKYIWKPEKEKLCQDFFKTQDWLYIYTQFMSSVIDLSDNQHLCKSLYNLLAYLADNCLKKVTKNKSTAKSNRFPTNPWFDNECKNIKHLCNRFSKTYALSISRYREEYHDLRKKYKKYIKNQVDKFQNLVSQNPNEYWKMWKQLKTNTNNVDIPISQFYETFKRQSQPPALAMFDTHFMCTISNYVENNKLCYNNDTNEANSYISNNILNGKITRNKIENAIRKVKNVKLKLTKIFMMISN